MPTTTEIARISKNVNPQLCTTSMTYKKANASNPSATDAIVLVVLLRMARSP